MYLTSALVSGSTLDLSLGKFTSSVAEENGSHYAGLNLDDTFIVWAFDDSKVFHYSSSKFSNPQVTLVSSFGTPYFLGFQAIRVLDGTQKGYLLYDLDGDLDLTEVQTEGALRIFSYSSAISRSLYCLESQTSPDSLLWVDFYTYSGAFLERKNEVSSYSTNGSLICLDAYARWLGNDSLLWADGADLIYGSMSFFNGETSVKRYSNGFNSGSTARKIADDGTYNIAAFSVTQFYDTVGPFKFGLLFEKDSSHSCLEA